MASGSERHKAANPKGLKKGTKASARKPFQKWTPGSDTPF